MLRVLGLLGAVAYPVALQRGEAGGVERADAAPGREEAQGSGEHGADAKGQGRPRHVRVRPETEEPRREHRGAAAADYKKYPEIKL